MDTIPGGRIAKIALFIGLSLCFAIILFLAMRLTPTGVVPFPTETAPEELPGKSRPALLSPNTAIIHPGSPIIGEAPGPWFFEASFPVALVTKDGAVLSRGIATALDEWMTERVVQFSVTLSFPPQDATTSAILILQKDNPSGLPEHDDEERITVMIAPGSAEQQDLLLVHFQRTGDEGDDCSRTATRPRIVPHTNTPARTALELLIAGPTEDELDLGYRSALPPPPILIRSLSIENGVAHVDFDKALDRTVAGSCRVGAIRSQIEATLRQFPSVSEVQIAVEGNTEEALQP